jgi:hypothetical protein
MVHIYYITYIPVYPGIGYYSKGCKYTYLEHFPSHGYSYTSRYMEYHYIGSPWISGYIA